MYYAAKNDYGSNTSVGFYNTWSVLVFDTKANRDNYVNVTMRDRMDVRAITRREAMRYCKLRERNPRPFTADYWAIFEPDDDDDKPQGYIGYVGVCAYDVPEWSPPRPFYSR